VLAELAVRGQAGAALHLARVLVREWLPLLLAAAALNRRARGALFAAAIVDVLTVWSATVRRGSGAPAGVFRATALHALDRSAYAAGMWREMARGRDFRALRPRLLRPGPDNSTK
jgi:hypothetical protein